MNEADMQSLAEYHYHLIIWQVSHLIAGAVYSNYWRSFSIITILSRG